MRRFEVGRANRTHPALFEQSQESPPCINVAVLIRVGPVDQQEVDIVHTQPSRARLERLGHELDAHASAC